MSLKGCLARGRLVVECWPATLILLPLQVAINDCSTTRSQQRWERLPDGGLRSPSTSRCLQAANTTTGGGRGGRRNMEGRLCWWFAHAVTTKGCANDPLDSLVQHATCQHSMKAIAQIALPTTSMCFSAVNCTWYAMNMTSARTSLYMPCCKTQTLHGHIMAQLGLDQPVLIACNCRQHDKCRDLGVQWRPE